MEVPFQRYIINTRSTGRIAYGRSENRGETERALRGHRLHRTTRHEREYLANSGKDRALSLRCIYEKTVLRRHPLKDRFPGCGRGSARFGGEELSAILAFRTSHP